MWGVNLLSSDAEVEVEGENQFITGPRWVLHRLALSCVAKWPDTEVLAAQLCGVTDTEAIYQKTRLRASQIHPPNLIIVDRTIYKVLKSLIKDMASPN